jgi:predicted site-specific integrase-resolvase
MQSHKGRIVVLYDERTTPEQELVQDILAITTVFSSRLYGLRSHSLKRKIRQAGKVPNGKQIGEEVQDLESQAFSE